MGGGRGGVYGPTDVYTLETHCLASVANDGLSTFCRGS